MSERVHVLVETLERLKPGEAVRIEKILFGALRMLCAELGIREGDEVSCRAATTGVVVIETATGHVVPLARDWARYIRTGALPAVPLI